MGDRQLLISYDAVVSGPGIYVCYVSLIEVLMTTVLCVDAVHNDIVVLVCQETRNNVKLNTQQ